MKIRKAVLPVAGLGTRFLPITKSIPKELLPIIDTPILQIIVEEALSIKIEEIIFVISPEKSSIKDYFSKNSKLEGILADKNQTENLKKISEIQKSIKFSFVEQKEALGDGHAILQARKFVGNEHFLVLFGDDLIVSKKSAAEQLNEVWQEKNSAVIALVEVDSKDVGNYGIIKPKPHNGDLMEIEDLVEKPKPEYAPSNLAIVGKYICPPQIFEILEKNPSQSGEIRLIDALKKLLKSESVFGKICEGERYDTGDKFGLLKANINFALRHPELAEKTKDYIKNLKL